MKTAILIAAMFIGLNTFATPAEPTINEKVLATFNQIFKDAINVEWSTHDNTNQAAFKDNGISVRAVFNMKGDLIRTIRYYKENYLPTNIIYKVRKDYSKQQIHGVTEVTVGSNTVYSIVLKDAKKYYKVNMDNDGYVLNEKQFNRGDI